jgi:hypothetical protein
LACKTDRIDAWVLGYTIAAELGDIARFPSPKKQCGDTGLCPRVYQSGSRDQRGPLAKNGPPYLRWARAVGLMDVLSATWPWPVALPCAQWRLTAADARRGNDRPAGRATWGGNGRAPTGRQVHFGQVRPLQAPRVRCGGFCSPASRPAPPAARRSIPPASTGTNAPFDRLCGTTA